MRQRGFTLVEILLYLVIFGMLLGMISAVLFGVLRSRSRVQTVDDVGNAIDLVIHKMTYEIQNAEQVSSPAKGTTDSSLILSNTTINPDNDPVLFSLNASDGRVYITAGAKTTEAISPDGIIVSDLSFTNVGISSASDSIRIEMTLDLDAASISDDFSYEQTIYTTVTVRK